MSQLSKTVIHNQVCKLAELYFSDSNSNRDEERRRALSKAYAQLCVKQLLELDEETASDAVVDGTNDMGIDAIWVDEPQNEYFNVNLFQIKYSENLDKDKGFAENEVIKLIATLRILLRKNHFDINSALDRQLALVKAHIDEFNIPNFIIYLCNNGQDLSNNAYAHIDSFLSESPENQKRYRFQYVNHLDIFRASERSEPVNCALDFSGGFIDEAINYKRAFVGKVLITQIAELLDRHQDRLLGRNVRDFLGFRRSVNDGIRATLTDPVKIKDFYFMNNGITFVCEKLDYAQGAQGARTRLTNAQIINGGQTSRTIQSVVHESPDIDFSQTYVLVRAYQIDMDDQSDLIHDIITATNSQNAIFTRDLHANDKVQRKLEAGLRHYGIRYLRRRDHHRAKADDIRMELAAECLVTVLLKKPTAAKYRKAMLFTHEFYPEIFDEDKITAELVWFIAVLFKKIESNRKHPASNLIKQYPFIPLVSHHLLLLIHHIMTNGHPVNHVNIHSLLADLSSGKYQHAYNTGLEIVSAVLTAKKLHNQTTDAYALSQILRSEQFTQEICGRIHEID